MSTTTTTTTTTAAGSEMHTIRRGDNQITLKVVPTAAGARFAAWINNGESESGKAELHRSSHDAIHSAIEKAGN